MAKDSVFRRVMDGLNSTSGDSPQQRREAAERKVKGRDQAAQDRARRNTQTKGFNRKAEAQRKAESEARWSYKGEDQ